MGDLTRLFSFVPPGPDGGRTRRSGWVRRWSRAGLFPQGGAYVQMGDRVSQEGGADIPTTWASVRTS